jgi:anaerobic dimethyl sulfoxide reductase subunit B (iron-sulfur subunit)
MACKDKNNTLVGLKYRSVIDFGGGSWTDEGGIPIPQGVYVYGVSYSCMHCVAPACIASCPTSAIVKREEDGVVYIMEDVCIGCGACVIACPYGAPRMDMEKGVAGKCNFCMDLLDAGENPACVDSCLMRCLEYGDIEELRQAHGDNAQIPPLVSPDQTAPNYVVKPHRLMPADGAGTVMNAIEELI